MKRLMRQLALAGVSISTVSIASPSSSSPLGAVASSQLTLNLFDTTTGSTGTVVFYIQ